ncbi:DUF4419 domain-containing protein [Paludisphaera mucosa]|uniref:DUF4419 domain-containing protein n=1 Tax=Paludisphaera mucosa TaxID=3030827 RepID=A0ABT6FAB6_9BACT|nr:DUF4419 domain-containing protein [Paludisphaera mucosa]MDG3004537.1 DUF4419 domain-containing protein [Paludisphaera mucosa]
MKAVSPTFPVSEVVRATTPLPEVPYKQAVEALLSTGLSESDLEMAEELAKQGLSLVLPEAPRSRPVEACTRYHGRLVAGVGFHPVAAAVHLAFVDHRPLILSPDAVWLMLIQAVANHVNAHADELRPRIVRHAGRVRIAVRRDDFLKGSPENPWPEAFAEFSSQVREHVGPKADAFLPAFSTTGEAERAAAEVVLLDAVQSYFDYAFNSMCGIPTITLEGTPEDWEALGGRAEAFAEFGLGRWLGVLKPILEQFVRASRGDLDPPFWRSLYKLDDQSGGPVITGWITAFFPYLKDFHTGRAEAPIAGFFADDGGRAERMIHPADPSPRAFASGPTIPSLPSGLSRAPFRWDHHGRAFDMEFLGGFVGVAQDPGTLALRPEIGWAVREADAG